ncbi:MAG: hypothetical protein HY955_01505 [Deltaproteobacteria bacterium]|nr:hypothetical protein [Deltaproteobacteria bacterium]
MAFTRKKIIINPYQIRLAMSLFIYIIVYSIILGFIIFYPLYQDLNYATGLEEQTRISATVLYLHKRVWIGLFVAAVLAAVHAIFSSHKVVGPVYRFEIALKDLIAGNYSSRVRIRKDDEFKEMEGLLNELSAALELKRNRDAQSFEDTKNRLETVQAMLDAEGARYPEDVKLHIRSIITGLNSRGFRK